MRKGHKRVMYVLRGLPETAMIETIAHEWGHAWQGENCPLLRDPTIREGFAEWTAYKALVAMGYDAVVPSAEGNNGCYGKGLRTMVQIERKHGIVGVLDFCRDAE